MTERIREYVLKYVAKHYEDNQFSQEYVRNVIIKYDCPDVTFECPHGCWSVESVVEDASSDADNYATLTAAIDASLGYFGIYYADDIYND